MVLRAELGMRSLAFKSGGSSDRVQENPKVHRHRGSAGKSEANPRWVCRYRDGNRSGGLESACGVGVRHLVGIGQLRPVGARIATRQGNLRPLIRKVAFHAADLIRAPR